MMLATKNCWQLSWRSGDTGKKETDSPSQSSLIKKPPLHPGAEAINPSTSQVGTFLISPSYANLGQII